MLDFIFLAVFVVLFCKMLNIVSCIEFVIKYIFIFGCNKDISVLLKI